MAKSKVGKRSKVLQEVRENPCFRKRVERSKKGKGSYVRKEKRPLEGV